MFPLGFLDGEECSHTQLLWGKGQCITVWIWLVEDLSYLEDSYDLWSFVVVCFWGTGDGTPSFTHTRPVFYHWATALALMVFMSLLICHFSMVGFLCWAAEHPSSKSDFYFILAHIEFQSWSQGLLPGGSDFSVSASLRRSKVLIILCCTTSHLKT